MLVQLEETKKPAMDLSYYQFTKQATQFKSSYGGRQIAKLCFHD